MQRVEVRFQPTQRVRINELKLEGTVMAIYHTVHDTTYEVRYFDNAQPRTVMFHSFELTEA